jgi:hypothetical protein
LALRTGLQPIPRPCRPHQTIGKKIPIGVPEFGRINKAFLVDHEPWRFWGKTRTGYDGPAEA